ncbi:MAG: DUF2868 domain-containing protein [Planctomycetota bacterium]
MTTADRSSSAADSSPRRRVLRRRDRLLAEAVRAFEHDGAALINDPRAAEVGRDGGDDLESRIVARAEALDSSPRLRVALHDTQRMFVIMASIAMGLGALAGAATIRTALGRPGDEPSNAFLVLGSALLLQTVLLIVWCVVMIVRPRAVASGSLGAIVLTAARWVGRQLRRDAVHIAAAEALGRRWLVGRSGVWTLSSISHATWLSFNIGALIAAMLLLSTRHYTFAWETTLFSDDPDAIYVPATRGLGWLPEQLGFAVPTEDQIRSSQWPGDPSVIATSRRPWSGLIVGSIVLYGFAPRLLLTAFCFGRRRHASKRATLDLESPYAHRLRALLMPESWHLGVVDPDEESTIARPESADSALPSATASDGMPAILGYELDQPGRHWPPSVHGVRWLDLGFVSTRDDRHRVYTQIRDATDAPRAIVVVASLATTPDRGVQRFLHELRELGGRPVVLVLTAGQSLRERATGMSMHQRLDDWHAVARDAGMSGDHVVEIDLDHLTDHSARQLGAAVGVHGEAGGDDRRIDRALDVIRMQSAAWNTTPDHAAQLALHREIAQIYRSEATQWHAAFGDAIADPKTAVDGLRQSASRLSDMLPPRLRTSPRWLGIGALAGALSCAAAASFIAPVAIASLPAWSGLGAAIAAVMPASAKAKDTDDRVDERDLSDAVHAALVTAIVFEFQGNGEAAITAALDAVIAEQHESIVLNDARTIDRYLDECRHRVDLVRASDAGSHGGSHHG